MIHPWDFAAFGSGLIRYKNPTAGHASFVANSVRTILGDSLGRVEKKESFFVLEMCDWVAIRRRTRPRPSGVLTLWSGAASGCNELYSRNKCRNR
jgi:hypothetical protein